MLPTLLRRLGLRLLVNGEALLKDPIAYLTARLWLAVGKRVRGRNQLSPLIGSTRLAYSLWVADREPNLWPSSDNPVDAARFAVVIDARRNMANLSATLASLENSEIAPDKVFVLVPEAPASLDASKDLLVVSRLSEVSSQLAAMDDTWFIALTGGDCLAAKALALFRSATRSGVAVIYADDDLLDERSIRHDPHFKPDWNAELFRHHDFVSGSAAIEINKASLAAFENCNAEDWITEVTRASIEASPVPPRHIPSVLFHRQVRPTPIVPSPKAITDRKTWPSLSVIIPIRNQVALLETCLAGLTATHYPVSECLIVDNGSDDPATLAFLEQLDPARFKVLTRPGPFNFAALNNAAAEQAQGEYLCLLNNDVSMSDPEWLHYMVLQAMRAEIGAVGARLYYPDGTLQHAGVVLGVGGGAAHAHRGLRAGESGYFCRPQLPQFASAVTAACLVVARDKFIAVGGFDADAFPVAFNDVDLCARLNAQGWQSFYEPRAILTHHESKSRGTDLTPEKKERFARELRNLKERWRTDRTTDPFHHPALSKHSDQFVVGL